MEIAKNNIKRALKGYYSFLFIVLFCIQSAGGMEKSCPESYNSSSDINALIQVQIKDPQGLSLTQQYQQNKANALTFLDHLKIPNKYQKGALIAFFTIFVPLQYNFIVDDIAQVKTEEELSTIISYDLCLKINYRLIYDERVLMPVCGLSEEIELVKKIIKAEKKERISPKTIQKFMNDHEKMAKELRKEKRQSRLKVNRDVIISLLQRITLLKNKK